MLDPCLVFSISTRPVVLLSEIGRGPLGPQQIHLKLFSPRSESASDVNGWTLVKLSESSKLQDVALKVWNVNVFGESATKNFSQSENVQTHWQTCRLI